MLAHNAHLLDYRLSAPLPGPWIHFINICRGAPASQHARIYNETPLCAGTIYFFENSRFSEARRKTICGACGEHAGLSGTVETMRAVSYEGLVVYWRGGDR